MTHAFSVGKTKGRWALCVALALGCTLLVSEAKAGISHWQILRADRVLDGQRGSAVREATTLAHDAGGRLWVGEHDGVTRLDGEVSHRYPVVATPGLRDGHVLALHALPGGDVLMGTQRGGLLHWSMLRDGFDAIKQPDGQRLRQVNAIRPAQAGGVWVASDQGLFHWRGPGAQLQPVYEDEALALPGRRVLDVLEQPNGVLWVATSRGVVRRAVAGGRFNPVRAGNAALDAHLAHEAVTVLTSDDVGNVWMGLQRSGVVVLPPDGRGWAPKGLDGTAVAIHGGHAIRSLLWHEGRMWVGMDSAGMMVVEQGRGRRSPLSMRGHGRGADLTVHQLIAGPDRRLWAATDQGVLHFSPRSNGVVELAADVSDTAVVRSLWRDGRQRLWLGMDRGRLAIMDAATGRQQTVQIPPSTDIGQIAVVGGDARGQVWVAGQSVARVDAQRLSVMDGGDVAQLSGMQYTAMAIRGERVWLGHLDGVLEMDLDGTVIRQMGRGEGALHSARVQRLLVEGDTLWVGTDTGLQRVDLPSWRAASVRMPEPRPGTVSTGTQVSSLMLHQGDVWVGTDDGLAKTLPGDKGTLQWVLGTGGGEVRDLQPDGEDGLWFTVGGGGVGHRNANGDVRLLGPRDGLPERLELSKGTVVAGDNGSLWLGGVGGVLQVDGQWASRPASPIPDLSPHLVDAWVNGVALPGSELPGERRPIRLSAKNDRVEVAFSVRDYVAPGARRYSFRLEGMDKADWSDVTDRARVMLYSSLPQGHYTLLMRATSKEFPGMEWISRIPVIVEPRWYQHPLSRVLFAASLVMLGWLIQRLREVRLQRHQVLLERTIDMRTTELRLANERLDRLAGEDPLTEMFNRRRILERLSEMHAHRQRVSGSDVLVMLDMDHFKSINDRHGHLAGDAVLREVARRIRKALRPTDLAARFGGEELLLVLPETAMEEAGRVVERLAQSLRGTPVSYGALWIPIKASFGLARMDPTLTVEDNLSRADSALYRAKSQGRDRMCIAP